MTYATSMSIQQVEDNNDDTDEKQKLGLHMAISAFHVLTILSLTTLLPLRVALLLLPFYG